MIKIIHCSWSKNCKEKTNGAGIPYCPLHYLAKEANYAIYDLEHLDKFSIKEREWWKEYSIRRLINFYKYFIKNTK